MRKITICTAENGWIITEHAAAGIAGDEDIHHVYECDEYADSQKVVVELLKRLAYIIDPNYNNKHLLYDVIIALKKRLRDKAPTLE